jgi:SAM-dependent methyltransferase
VWSFLTTGRVKFPKNVRFADVSRRIPTPSASIDYVYCSHALEHLARDDLKSALRETFRILKPGGVFRGVMPNLAHEVDTYLAKLGESEASVNFMSSSLLGLERRPLGVVEIVISLLGNDWHLYLWDFAGIERELHDADFISVRRVCIGDHPSGQGQILNR